MDIKELNNPKYNIEWDELQYDVWEVFSQPHEISDGEIYMARLFLDLMKIDLDDEYIITFRSTPVHLGYIIVHFLRYVNKKHPNLISEENIKKIIYDDYSDL